MYLISHIPYNQWLYRNFNNVKILSIGRVDPPKGYDIALFAIKKLVEEKYDIHWYIIGEGPQRKELEILIALYSSVSLHFTIKPVS